MSVSNRENRDILRTNYTVDQLKAMKDEVLIELINHHKRGVGEEVVCILLARDIDPNIIVDGLLARNRGLRDPFDFLFRRSGWFKFVEIAECQKGQTWGKRPHDRSLKGNSEGKTEKSQCSRGDGPYSGERVR